MAGKGTDFGQFLHRLVATGLHGEMSDATIQGYLRAASQLESVWQQLDEQVDTLIGQGVAPWEAYARMGYALAFVRACRMNVVFVQELLRAAGGADAATGAYLPRVTYDQALVLCEQIEPYLEEAILAQTHPRYMPGKLKLPLALGPRMIAGDQSLPLTHLMGILGAAHEIREWTAGLLAKYELALNAAKLPVPPMVITHLDTMRGKLRLGEFHLQTGTDMAAHVSQGQQVADKLGGEGEKLLWEAMQDFYLVSQLVAYPGAAIQSSAGRPDVSAPHQPQSSPTSPATSPAALARPTPAPPDLLSQLQLTTPTTPAPPSVPNLLNQLQMINPPPPPPQTFPGEAVPPPKTCQSQRSAETTANDLISELFGEQGDLPQ